MNHRLHAYTPVRQSQDANRPNSASHTNAKVWTANRCQRWLRPITSRVELLKKDLARFAPSEEPNNSFEAETESIKISGSKSPTAKNVGGEDDACWRPARRRLRKTYSTRGKLKSDLEMPSVCRTFSKSQQTNHGRMAFLLSRVISVPTSISDRSQIFMTSSQRHPMATLESNQIEMRKCSHSRYTAIDGDAHFQSTEIMRQLSDSVASYRYNIYKGIYNALEALLWVTLSAGARYDLPIIDHKHEIKGSGIPDQGISRSRSLFSMCLRAIPSYIREVERSRELELENTDYKLVFDTRTISLETYSELESLGTTHTGWVHLKTVVRAHGVHTISDAIQKGFVDVNFASVLVMLCVHSSAFDEAQALLSSLLMAQQYPLPLSPQCHFCDVQAMLPFITLDNFFKYTDRVAFYHRQMTRLIANGSLPPLWLGTNACGRLWTSVFRAISIDPYDRDATAFIAVSIPLMLSDGALRADKKDNEPKFDMSKVLDTIFLSVLTTLSAMSILNVTYMGAIVPLLRSIFHDCQITIPKIDENLIGFIAIANIIIGMVPFEGPGIIRSSLEVLTRSSRIDLRSRYIEEDIPEFVCAISRCCGCGSFGDGFEYLVLILNRLTKYICQCIPDERVVLRTIIVNCAFAYAQWSPSQECLEYARRIAKQMQLAHIANKSSPNIDVKASTIAFRWEEGISEWVTASPGCLKKSLGAKDVFSDEESDFDTPIRPSIKRQKRGEALPKNIPVMSCGHYLKARISDLSPTNPTNGDKDSHYVKLHQYQVHKRLARQDRRLWAQSRNQNRNKSKGQTSTIPKAGDELVRPRLGGRLLASSDDELNCSGPSMANITGVVTEGINSSIEAFRKIHNRQHKSSVGGSAMIALLSSRRLEQSEDELGL